LPFHNREIQTGGERGGKKKGLDRLFLFVVAFVAMTRLCRVILRFVQSVSGQASAFASEFFESACPAASLHEVAV
jgi:hypothetical protein